MNIKNLILGLIIAVVFLMFCVYGTNLIYKTPEYIDFCNNSYYNAPMKTLPPENCSQYNDAVNRKSQECWNSKGVTNPVYDEKGCETDVACDFCNKKYDVADEVYSKNLFVISLVFSVIIIIISVVLVNVPSVYGGLMLGSFAFIIYGTSRYWRFMNDWIRFIVLGAALVILVYVAYYISRKEINKKK